jgi:hypothetical protein
MVSPMNLCDPAASARSSSETLHCYRQERKGNPSKTESEDDCWSEPLRETYQSVGPLFKRITVLLFYCVAQSQLHPVKVKVQG